MRLGARRCRSLVVRHVVRPVMFASAAAALGLGGCGDDKSSNPNENNQPPTIHILTASLPVAATGDTVDVTCYAHDEDDDVLTYTWSAPDGVLIGSGDAVKWRAPGGDGPHEIRLAVADAHGHVARDTVLVEVMEGTLLVSSRDGIDAVDAYGNKARFGTSEGFVEVLGTRIFLGPGGVVTEIDHTGAEIDYIDVPEGASGYDFAMLPDGGLALLDNDGDHVNFLSSSGVLVETVGMPEPSPGNLQSVDGVLAGARLVVSENGTNGVVAFDLGTRQGSVLRRVDDGQGWLGAIDYDDGVFYLCRSQTVQRFTEGGDLETVCTLPGYHITGITVAGSYAYVVLNFADSIYRVDLRDGTYVQFRGDIDNPKDIEYLPVRLDL